MDTVCVSKFGGLSIFLIYILPLAFFLVIFSEKSLAISSTDLKHTEYRQVSSLRLGRIQRHLKKINKPPMFTIQVFIYLDELIFIYFEICVCVWNFSVFG